MTRSLGVCFAEGCSWHIKLYSASSVLPIPSKALQRRVFPTDHPENLIPSGWCLMCPGLKVLKACSEDLYSFYTIMNAGAKCIHFVNPTNAPRASLLCREDDTEFCWIARKKYFTCLRGVEIKRRKFHWTPLRIFCLWLWARISPWKQANFFNSWVLHRQSQR